MKHIFTRETLKITLILHIVLYLSFFPFVVDSLFAQRIDVEGPVISHFPKKVARHQRKLTIRAHIFDENEIEHVTLILTHGEQTVRGTMPKNATNGMVPVEAFTKYQAPLFSGPGAEFKVRSTIRQGELVGVSRLKNNYARILSATGIRGYVNVESLEIVTNGYSYGVTIPPSMTNVDVLQYQIEAVDNRGNISLSDKVTIRLLTENEIQTALSRLQQGESNVVLSAPSSSPSTPATSQPENLKEDPLDFSASSSGDIPGFEEDVQDTPNQNQPYEIEIQGMPGEEFSDFQDETISDEEISHKTPVYEKTWFWGAVGLVGAGAAILLSDSEDKTDEPATIDVIVEWE